MKELIFERRKYGKELLIDACNVDELVIQGNELVLTFYCIILLEETEGIYHLDTEKIVLQHRIILFVKPGQISRIDQATFTKGYFLFFEEEFLDEFFSDQFFIYKFAFFHQPVLPSFMLLPPKLFHQQEGVLEEIWREIKELSIDSPHILRSLVYYLLVKLNRHYASIHQLSPYTLLDTFLLHFFKLLEKELRSYHHVQDYAEKLNLSRGRLNQLCQKHFGKTASQIIRERLLLEIKKEIIYSDKQLAEISYEFQFSAPSHMTRFFKQMTGYSPLQYREDFSNW